MAVRRMCLKEKILSLVEPGVSHSKTAEIIGEFVVEYSIRFEIT